jgi:hypothetical protein
VDFKGGIKMNIDEMQAGREMDALIAEKVMGFTVKCILGRYQIALFNVGTGEKAPGIFKNLPYYSTNIVAAWNLLEHIKKSVKITVYEPNDTALDYVYMEWYGGQWDMVLGFTPSEDERFYGTADTLPLAICRAALKVVTEEANS